VTVIVPGVVTAAVAETVRTTWTSIESVEVKLGEVVLEALVKASVTALAEEVTFVVYGADPLIRSGLVVCVEVPPPTVKPSVTPAGIPLNVNRIFVPFFTAVLLFELCKAVRQAVEKPSVM
jgi:hypothetical protein